MTHFFILTFINIVKHIVLSLFVFFKDAYLKLFALMQFNSLIIQIISADKTCLIFQFRVFIQFNLITARISSTDSACEFLLLAALFLAIAALPLSVFIFTVREFFPFLPAYSSIFLLFHR